MTLIRLLIPMLVFPLAVLAQTASSKGRYIVIVGMLSEKKIADGSNVVVITGAMKEASLRETLAKLDSTGAKGVISFGVAGGLNPDLKVGQLIIPQTIVFGKNVGIHRKVSRTIFACAPAAPECGPSRERSPLLKK